MKIQEIIRPVGKMSMGDGIFRIIKNHVNEVHLSSDIGHQMLVDDLLRSTRKNGKWMVPLSHDSRLYLMSDTLPDIIHEAHCRMFYGTMEAAERLLGRIESGMNSLG